MTSARIVERGMRILSVFGTRPEAIKLAPVVKAFALQDGVVHAACVTAQHRSMLDQVLNCFELKPDYDLNLMKPGQDLGHITCAVLTGVSAVVESFKPDWVIVQGDTTTAFAAALAAFYRKVGVVHVEAGLRTGNIYSPWPEEMNRKLVTQLTTLHCPPTELAAGNLRSEGIPEDSILVTGNTVIDALKWMENRLLDDAALRGRCERELRFLDSDRRLILVTGHRRENFEGGIERVCRAIKRLADRGDVQVVYPVHLNPKVQAVAKAVLGNSPAVHLIEPVDYMLFVFLMRRSYLIITDSGGIQEEAPGLGKPVIVTRNTTERPEAIAAGTAILVGTEEDNIVACTQMLLDDGAAYQRMARANNPFGDGHAAQRIVEFVCSHGRQ